jgi:DNA modification methylase
VSYQYVFHLPHKYQLRGFEEELALLELRALGLSQSRREGNALYVDSSLPTPKDKLERLTFFERVDVQHGAGSEVVVPYQVLIDQTAKAVRLVGKTTDSKLLLSAVEGVQNGRREHTYLTHSYHSYKGKYYPQLVKSLMNYVGVGPGDLVLDPFVGSGTTLVECFLNGVSGIGVDLNPLAVLMSNAKVEALRFDPAEVDTQTKQLKDRLKRTFKHSNIWDLGTEEITYSDGKNPDYGRLLSDIELPNTEYLSRWFPQEALVKFGLILSAIDTLESSALRDLCRVTLSNIVRFYSLQEPTQLRIRRRNDIPSAEDLLLKFFQGLRDNTAAIHLYHAIRPKCPKGSPKGRAYHGDIRNLRAIPSPYLHEDEQLDAAITSPPYATALPYIDTDRLSLFLLGLLDASKRWDLEAEMIGNREIRDRERRALEEEFVTTYETNPLPQSVKDLLREILERNERGNVGFRRRNTASLLFKYFSDMRQGFAEVYRVLKPGALFFVVVGNSTTVAGGKPIEIPTDEFLIEIGKTLGFTLDTCMPMTDQPAYMVHSKNMIRKETIFGLRKPKSA